MPKHEPCQVLRNRPKMSEPITVCKCTDDGYWENGRLISRWIFNTSQPFLGQPSAAEVDKHETAAWYGRGEKPEHEPLDWVRFELIETAKPAKPGLFVVQGEGRYQGLGFNGEAS